MTHLRWGIVGPGGIAHTFTQDLRLSGFDVRAVASRSAERADVFAAEFDLANAYASTEALAADPEVDIVYIATPHPQHAAPALEMIAAGKHVLVEKAFTANAAQAIAIRDAAREAGVLAMEAMWTRYLPHMVRIRELVAAGDLGELTGLIADHTQRLSDDPEHRINNLALGGGALLDLGIYPISFAWDLFGAPTTVQATGALKATGADAQVTTLFGYVNGAIASTFSSSISRGPNRATVLGTDATLEIDPVWYTATSFQLRGHDGTVREEFHSDVVGRGMQYQAFAAEALVESGDYTTAALTIDESVEIMHCLDGIRKQLGVRYPADDDA